MTPRPLGQSGIDIAPIALGGNVFGWSADTATSHALLDRFVDAGFNLVDTADAYSAWVPGNRGGESERRPQPGAAQGFRRGHSQQS